MSQQPITPEQTQAVHRRTLAAYLNSLQVSLNALDKNSESAYYTAARANEPEIQQAIYDLMQLIKQADQIINHQDIQALRAIAKPEGIPF